jgi:hypothetical protein
MKRFLLIVAVVATLSVGFAATASAHPRSGGFYRGPVRAPVVYGAPRYYHPGPVYRAAPIYHPVPVYRPVYGAYPYGYGPTYVVPSSGIGIYGRSFGIQLGF